MQAAPFCDGHGSAFAFFGGVPLSILYDNTTIAVAKICGDGRRERTRPFASCSHIICLTTSSVGPHLGHGQRQRQRRRCDPLADRPCAASTRGGYGRRNFLVPASRFCSFGELNVWLEAQCLKRQNDTVRDHTEPIGDRLMRDLDALMARPPTPYDACEKVSTRATSISMVRYRNNDYSVPVAYAHPLPGRACLHAREERGSGSWLCP